jgi:hypothetical protein
MKKILILFVFVLLFSCSDNNYTDISINKVYSYIIEQIHMNIHINLYMAKKM